MRIDWRNLSTEEKIEFVKGGIAKNMTSGMIANEIVGATRNAVIGVCHRFGLQLPGKSAMRSAQTKEPEARNPQRPRAARSKPAYRPPAPPPAKQAEPPADAVPDEVKPVPRHRRVSMLQLTEHTCKWPLNQSYITVPVDEMMFCGNPKEMTAAYCVRCAQKCVEKRRG